MSNNKLCVCPTCGDLYTLGVTGTVQGCDVCQGISRNPIDHTIIDDEDELTDPEKA